MLADDAELVYEVIAIAAAASPSSGAEAAAAAFNVIGVLVCGDKANALGLFLAHTSALVPALVRGIEQGGIDAITPTHLEVYSAALGATAALVSYDDIAARVMGDFPQVFDTLLGSLSYTVGGDFDGEEICDELASYVNRLLVSLATLANDTADRWTIINNHPEYLSLLVTMLTGENCRYDAFFAQTFSALYLLLNNNHVPYGMLAAFPELLPCLLCDLQVYSTGKPFAAVEDQDNMLYFLDSVLQHSENAAWAMANHADTLVPLLLTRIEAAAATSAADEDNIETGLRDRAVSALFQVTSNVQHAEQVVFKYHNKLLPVMLELVSSPQYLEQQRQDEDEDDEEEEDQLLPSAYAVLHNLSCSPANLPALRGYPGLVRALQRARDCGGHAASTASLLALINIERAVDGNPGFKLDQKTCKALIAVLGLVVEKGDDEESMRSILLAFRYALQMSLGVGNLDNVECAVSAFLQLTGDAASAERAWLAYTNLPLLLKEGVPRVVATATVAPSSSTTRATTAAKLLMQRFDAVQQADDAKTAARQADINDGMLAAPAPAEPHASALVQQFIPATLYTKHSTTLIPPIDRILRSNQQPDDDTTAQGGAAPVRPELTQVLYAVRVIFHLTRVAATAEHMAADYPNLAGLFIGELNRGMVVTGKEAPSLGESTILILKESMCVLSKLIFRADAAKQKQLLAANPDYLPALLSAASSGPSLQRLRDNAVFALETIFRTQSTTTTVPYGLLTSRPTLLPAMLEELNRDDNADDAKKLTLQFQKLYMSMLAHVLLFPENAVAATTTTHVDLVASTLMACCFSPLPGGVTEADYEPLRITALNALSSITSHETLAEKVFAAHHGALLPALLARIGRLPMDRIAYTLMHNLSRPQANHLVMCEFPNLLPVVRREMGSRDAYISSQCLFVLVNVGRAMPGKPALAIDRSMCVEVLDELTSAVNNTKTERAIRDGITAMRHMCAVPGNRAMLWEVVSRGGQDFTYPIRLITRAMEKSLDVKDYDSLENSLLVMAQMSADGPPVVAISDFKPRFLAVIDRVMMMGGTSAAEEEGEHSATMRAAKLLQLRLQAMPVVKTNTPTVVAAAADAAKPRHFGPVPARPAYAQRYTQVQQLVHADLRDAVRANKWDLVLSKLAKSKSIPTSHLLGVALHLDAPYKVFEYLVVDRKCNVLEPLSGPHAGLPFYLANQLQRVDVSILLAEHGAARAMHSDVNGTTPLIVSCSHPVFLPLTRKLVQILTKRELDYVPPHSFQLPALAASCGMERCHGLEQARCMLEAGANPNVVTHTGWTPLSLAVCSGHLPIVKLLLKHGADPKLLHYHGKIILSEMAPACECRPDESVLVEMLELLIQHGALASSELVFSAVYALEPPFPRLTRRWIELGNLNIQALAHMATFMGRDEDLKWLIQHGADVNQVGQGWALQLAGPHVEKNMFRGVTPLFTWLDYSPARSTPEQVKLLRTMLLAGGDLGGVDPGKALGESIDGHSLDLLTLMLQAGADKTSAMWRGQRVFDYARSKGYTELLPLLLQAEEKASDVGVLDPDNKGLEFVFTHCAACRKRGDYDRQGCIVCVMVAYCNEECQQAHWKKHKAACKKKREIEETRKS